MKILLQNLQKVEVTLLGINDSNETKKIGKKNIEMRNEQSIQDVIFGRYEKILVSKYISNLIN